MWSRIYWTTRFQIHCQMATNLKKMQQSNIWYPNQQVPLSFPNKTAKPLCFLGIWNKKWCGWEEHSPLDFTGFQPNLGTQSVRCLAKGITVCITNNWNEPVSTLVSCLFGCSQKAYCWRLQSHWQPLAWTRISTNGRFFCLFSRAGNRPVFKKWPS